MTSTRANAFAPSPTSLAHPAIARTCRAVVPSSGNSARSMTSPAILSSTPSPVAPPHASRSPLHARPHRAVSFTLARPARPPHPLPPSSTLTHPTGPASRRLPSRLLLARFVSFARPRPPAVACRSPSFRLVHPRPPCRPPALSPSCHLVLPSPTSRRPPRASSSRALPTFYALARLVPVTLSRPPRRCTSAPSRPLRWRTYTPLVPSHSR